MQRIEMMGCPLDVASMEETINVIDDSKVSANLQLNAVKNAANGIMVGQVPEELVNTYIALQEKSNIARFAITLGASLIGFFVVMRNINPELRARNRVENIIMIFMFISSFISIIITVGIVLSLIFETLKFFSIVSPIEFFFGTTWSPQIALREDQVASSGSFGSVPVFAGTMLILSLIHI